MACGEPATVSAAVRQVATPLALTATLLQLAIVVPSALNVTLPSLLGLPEPAPVPVTVAVKRSEERVEGKSVDLGGRRIIKKKMTVCPPDRVPVLLAKLAPLAESAVIAGGETAM